MPESVNGTDNDTDNGTDNDTDNAEIGTTCADNGTNVGTIKQILATIIA